MGRMPKSCPHFSSSVAQRNRDNPRDPVHTPIGVAKYFIVAGTKALQALPLLVAHPQYGGNHPIMQHPAINNARYREYMVQQTEHVKGLLLVQQLAEVPMLQLRT